jgi:uncharacterized protein (DUF2252 family)
MARSGDRAQESSEGTDVSRSTRATVELHEGPPTHVVLREVEGRSGAARAAWGREARRTVPRESLAVFNPDGSRVDPVGILEDQARTRVPELIPIRHARMLTSPFAFLRGSAAVMAADLARSPTTGIPVQLCGDAHIANFGIFATPERNLVFDLNDFDETHQGPFEWDVKRLAASAVVAARERGFGDRVAAAAAFAAVRSYRDGIHDVASMTFLEAWYHRVSVSDIFRALEAQARDGQQRRAIAKAERRLAREAQNRTSMGSLSKLAEHTADGWRIREKPPLITRYGLTDQVREQVRVLFEQYAASLRPELHILLGAYRPVDLARKVVGVGSVGTQAFMFLLASTRDADVLFLQLKEAQRSVIAPYVEASAVAGTTAIDHDGQRVVVGQRLMQAASDQFLGWASGGSDGRQAFYLRQLRDMKVSVDVTAMAPDSFLRYVALCGRSLAFAHGRSGSASAIAGYAGRGDGFIRAITAFARDYADRTELDHAAMAEAAREGRIVAAAEASSPG